ncbi:MAG: methyltransferase regulatory domain-containing protein [Candidatus Competibacterales bacterium]
MTTASWGHGYVTDLEYHTAYHHDLAPINHHYLCLLQRIQPPTIDQPFVHLDLGSGDGFTNVLLAAANPHGQFYAVDFNPAHIRRGQTLASLAGLDNITFVEASFEDLHRHGIPPADFVTCYGVFSWIDPGLRQALIDYVGERLKPGGVFFVSYNTLPGWLAAMPLQRLIYEQVSRQSPGSDRVKEAIATLGQLDAAGGLFFKAYPSAQRRLKHMGEKSSRYLTHEYVNRHWQPLFQFEVDRLLAPAKLTRVGSLRIGDNFPERFVPKNMGEVIDSFPEDLQETALDLLLNQAFRRDLYITGAVSLSPNRQRQLLGRLRVALARTPDKIALNPQTYLGKLTLQRDRYQPLIDALAEAPRTLADLAGALNVPFGDVLDMTAQLAGYEQLHVLLPTPKDSEGLRRFNQQVLLDGEYHRQTLALASPEMGAGAVTRPLELTLLAVERSAPALAERLAERLQGEGLALAEDGKTLDPADQQRAVEQFIAQFHQRRRPVLRQLGVI